MYCPQLALYLYRVLDHFWHINKVVAVIIITIIIIIIIIVIIIIINDLMHSSQLQMLQLQTNLDYSDSVGAQKYANLDSWTKWIDCSKIRRHRNYWYWQNCTNLVPRLLSLLGQQVVSRRDAGALKTIWFFDWLFTVTKLRTCNHKISVAKSPVPQSLSWWPPAVQEVCRLWEWD